MLFCDSNVIRVWGEWKLTYFNLISRKNFFVLALYFCCISNNFGSFSVFFPFSLWAVKKNQNSFEAKSFAKCFALSYCLFAMALNQVHKWENGFWLPEWGQKCWLLHLNSWGSPGVCRRRHFILIISKALGAHAAMLQMRDLILSEVTGSCPSSHPTNKGLTLWTP